MKLSQQQQGYMKVVEVLHLQGPYISMEMLTAAVGRLQRRHPILRSRLRMRSVEPGSYLLDEDDTLRLTIREIPRNRDEYLHFWRTEWRKREKKTTVIGEGLVEFWLLQDPNDNGPREVVIICEHSVCDGISLSVVAHELLVSLSGGDENMFTRSLNWPLTMETAIKKSLSILGRLFILSKFILATLYLYATTRSTVCKIPLANIDFPLIDMATHCHTEAAYGILNKEDTQKLIEKCHQMGVTVTSAVSSALMCATSTLVNGHANSTSVLNFSISADTRKRCVPPVPNHDLSVHASATMMFTLPIRDVPTTTESRWHLAQAFGRHVKMSINAGHVLALGMILGSIYPKVMNPPNPADPVTCIVTSWGILPFHERYGRWKLTAMMPCMNMIRGGMPLTSIQTVNGVLTIMCLGPIPVFSQNTIEKLCDVTMHSLREMFQD
ncbi:unnamed protein product [Rotaria socialis]|uniref:Phthiocerol/phthiodiolone dimycocerosyl transferase C-terminal domain-containing protein n=1 Tax=Rotaria socialis TaxID=392032 RepID=A0A820U5Y2_9BILA|nr:unnamed protein product [Rotaria socialis]CAF4486290.1 unnamed protein product [Rotaria socialis]